MHSWFSRNVYVEMMVRVDLNHCFGMRIYVTGVAPDLCVRDIYFCVVCFLLIVCYIHISDVH